MVSDVSLMLVSLYSSSYNLLWISVDKLLSFPPVNIINVIYVVGFALLLYAIIRARQSVEPSNWPSAIGTIFNLSLCKKAYSDGSTYEVKVGYRYTVMDRTYTSSRLAFGYFFSEARQVHQAIFNKLEHASSVKVRYNPRNPAISALSFGIHHSIKFFFAFAIFWLAFGFCFSLLLWIESLPSIKAFAPFALISALIMMGLLLSWGVYLLSWMEAQPDHVLLNNIEVTPTQKA